MAFGKTSKDPFSTHVGHLIEICTVGTVHSEDWGQFMNICDFINTTEEGPRDAVKALKRRISKNYNHKEVRLSLSLLDMCMQNCCETFQSLVVKKDFCKVLVKMLNPKYNLPIVMQNKILRFILAWSKGFRGGSVDVSDVKEVYLDLLKKGIIFPTTEANGETTFEEHVSASQTSKPPLSCSPSSSSTVAPPPAAATVLLAPEQIGKLYSELDMVKMNVTVMSAILLENAPDTNNLEDIDLLQKLHTTCRSMQERIMALLEAVQNDDVTAELIQVNDDLNNAFLRYERFSRNRIRVSEEHKRQAVSPEIDNKAPSAPASDLIDLSSRSQAPQFQTQSAENNVADPNIDTLTKGFENSSNSLASHHYSNFMPPSAANSIPTKPFLYPQLGLLTLGDNGAAPFAIGTQGEYPSLPPAPTYDNGFSPLPASHQLPTVLAPEPFHFPLQIETADEVPQATTAGETKDNSPPPSYYELLEFDPLADTNGTEAIYEDIDKYIFKSGVKQNTEC